MSLCLAPAHRALRRTLALATPLHNAERAPCVRAARRCFSWSLLRPASFLCFGPCAPPPPPRFVSPCCLFHLTAFLLCADADGCDGHGCPLHSTCKDRAAPLVGHDCECDRSFAPILGSDDRVEACGEPTQTKSLCALPSRTPFAGPSPPSSRPQSPQCAPRCGPRPARCRSLAQTPSFCWAPTARWPRLCGRCCRPTCRWRTSSPRASTRWKRRPRRLQRAWCAPHRRCVVIVCLHLFLAEGG